MQTACSVPAAQLYSLQSGRLVAPSLFRLACFQNARFNISTMSSYGYKKRSERTTHDGVVTCTRVVQKPSDAH